MSVKVRVACFDPVDAGEKVTETAHVAPMVTDELEQVFEPIENSLEFAPASCTAPAPKLRVSDPVLVMVTVLAAEVEPGVMLPTSTEVADGEKAASATWIAPIVKEPERVDPRWSVVMPVPRSEGAALTSGEESAGTSALVLELNAARSSAVVVTSCICVAPAAPQEVSFPDAFPTTAYEADNAVRAQFVAIEPSGLETTVPIRMRLLLSEKLPTLLDSTMALLPEIVENCRLDVPAMLVALAMTPPTAPAVLPYTVEFLRIKRPDVQIPPPN